MSTDQSPQPAPLFHESGASWYWVLAGPAAGLAMLLIEMSSGSGAEPLLPTVFLVLVSSFIALQVKAARIHTSVELTEQTLRQGTETIQVADILRVYPEPENSVRSGEKLEPWQSARALGELSGVPRGRTGIGIRLTSDRTVQAWARRYRHLRVALTPLVEERATPVADEDADADDTGCR